MASPIRGAMLMLHGATPRDRDARDQLREVLSHAEMTEPDQLGVLEITVEAADLGSALSVSGMPWRAREWHSAYSLRACGAWRPSGRECEAAASVLHRPGRVRSLVFLTPSRPM